MIGGEEMAKIINSGVYCIDLKGEGFSEFSGEHPTLVLRCVSNRDEYFAIPLTSYTKERWEKYKKTFCVRITTFNSIARIDRMAIISKNKIGDRWYKNQKLLIPHPKEIAVIYKRIEDYLHSSIAKSLKNYNDFYKQYTQIYDLYTKLFIEHDKSVLQFFIINKNNKELIVSTELKKYTNLSFLDISKSIQSIVGTNGVRIDIDESSKLIIVRLRKNKKISLTFCKWYDKIILWKGYS